MYFCTFFILLFIRCFKVLFKIVTNIQKIPLDKLYFEFEDSALKKTLSKLAYQLSLNCIKIHNYAQLFL